MFSFTGPAWQYYTHLFPSVVLVEKHDTVFLSALDRPCYVFLLGFYAPSCLISILHSRGI